MLPSASECFRALPSAFLSSEAADAAETTRQRDNGLDTWKRHRVRGSVVADAAETMRQRDNGLDTWKRHRVRGSVVADAAETMRQRDNGLDTRGLVVSLSQGHLRPQSPPTRCPDARPRYARSRCLIVSEPSGLRTAQQLRSPRARDANAIEPPHARFASILEPLRLRELRAVGPRIDSLSKCIILIHLSKQAP